MADESEFIFNGPNDYPALRERCLALPDGDRLTVRITDTRKQSPDALASRINEELSDRWLFARSNPAHYGAHNHQGSVVVVHRTQIDRKAIDPKSSTANPTCSCSSPNVRMAPTQGGYLMVCLECPTNLYIRDNLLTAGERQWLKKRAS